MSTKGQTINDRINAAKYTLAGQALARCICKATTEELMRPKMKHLDYLAASTYQPNVSMQQLANMLVERTNHSNWAVVYKALITVHHLMCHGSEKFTQYLASSNYTFQLSNFLDRIITKGYEMSQFIRRYSNYINQKALTYRKLAIDLCRSQRKKGEDGVMRTMPIERLLETLPILQKQLDCLLDFSCTADDLNNSIVTACFTLLYHDVVRLFANYNDGIISLIEKYFDLNKKMCREAFEAYKKFLSCTDRVYEFLKVAEAINLNRGELPDFKRAPQSLLDAFEQHLLSLENNKKRDIKPDVDTKLAAFPSFTVNPEPVSSNEAKKLSYFEPDTLGDLANEFESQLTFSTSDNEFGNETSNATVTTNNNNDVFSTLPFDDNFVPSSASVKTTTTGPSKTTDIKAASASPFDAFEAPSLASNDLFDATPPKFADGSLLTPEALQIEIDPSVDPHMKQQLIQIKREQVLASRQGGNISSQKLSSKQHSIQNTKPNKASMFEDLEKVMRQSLTKTENP